MNCKKAIHLMSDYIEGLLPGHVQLELELHIADCPECADQLQVTEDMVDSLKQLSVQKCPVDCWSAVRSHLPEHSPKRPWYEVLLRPVVAAPAVAVAILLLVMLVWPISFQSNPGTDATVTLPEYSNYVSAHADAQRQEALSDPDVTFVSAELEKASLTDDFQP